MNSAIRYAWQRASQEWLAWGWGLDLALASAILAALAVWR